MQTMTFSSTATALSALIPVDMGDSSPTYPGGLAAVRVFATSSGTGGTAGAIEFVLVSKGVRLATFPATVTVTTRRADAAGTGGAYLCDVAFAEGSTSKFDLLGSEIRNGMCAPGLSGDDAGSCWMVGCSSLGSLTAITLNLAPSAVI